MSKFYAIQWKSKVNGRAGRGTKLFELEEADRLAEELNREFPKIHHESVPTSSPEEPITERINPTGSRVESPAKFQMKHRSDRALAFKWPERRVGCRFGWHGSGSGCQRIPFALGKSARGDSFVGLGVSGLYLSCSRCLAAQEKAQRAQAPLIFRREFLTSFVSGRPSRGVYAAWRNGDKGKECLGGVSLNLPAACGIRKIKRRKTPRSARTIERLLVSLVSP